MAWLSPPGWNNHPPLPAHSQPVISGGLPGWQATLIAATAALIASALAANVCRMRGARRHAAARA